MPTLIYLFEVVAAILEQVAMDVMRTRELFAERNGVARIRNRRLLYPVRPTPIHELQELQHAQVGFKPIIESIHDIRSGDLRAFSWTPDDPRVSVIWRQHPDPVRRRGTSSKFAAPIVCSQHQRQRDLLKIAETLYSPHSALSICYDWKKHRH